MIAGEGSENMVTTMKTTMVTTMAATMATLNKFYTKAETIKICYNAIKKYLKIGKKDLILMQLLFLFHKYNKGPIRQLYIL